MGTPTLQGCPHHCHVRALQDSQSLYRLQSDPVFVNNYLKSNLRMFLGFVHNPLNIKLQL